MAAPNFHNRTLFHGDNLPFLRNINSECVDLIATDPPFNKGRDFHATPDSLAKGAKFQDRWSWADDVEGEWVDQITDDWPNVMTVINGTRTSYGDDMGAFLCFMAVRLLAMRRVLKPTGSIYLHCDRTASHYLKQLMDAIFGKKNFINEIIWCYEDVGGRATNYFKHKHDVIFMYQVSKQRKFHIQRKPLSESTIKRYAPYFDANGQITYRALKASNPGVFKKLKGIPDDLNRVWLDQQKGAPLNDWWMDISPIKKGFGESSGYPTQKPLALYERIIKASSNEGDVVLDPFAGCATTAVAAERLERRWVGIDIWQGAHGLVLDRLRSETQASMAWNDHVTYATNPPHRTDTGEKAAPYLQVTERFAEPDGPKMSRAEMYEYLLAQRGQRCQGCDRAFDDPRYLELDHNTPRSDGGLNHITNRVLLCGPCNRAKSNTYTLSGLRRLNRKNGWMATKN